MGLFSKPRCPKCGNKCEPTHYAFPFPQWRCRACIRRNSEKKKEENRIAELEERIRRLEGGFKD